MTNPAGLRQTEKDFQAAVVEYAKLNGWMVFHPFDSRRSEPGWPDLTMVRDGRLVFAELKTDKGRISEAQAKWIDALSEVKAGIRPAVPPKPVQVFIWRPSDWPEIEATLKRRAPEAPWWSKP